MDSAAILTELLIFKRPFYEIIIWDSNYTVNFFYMPWTCRRESTDNTILTAVFYLYTRCVIGAKGLFSWKKMCFERQTIIQDILPKELKTDTGLFEMRENSRFLAVRLVSLSRQSSWDSRETFHLGPNQKPEVRDGSPISICSKWDYDSEQLWIDGSPGKTPKFE